MSVGVDLVDPLSNTRQEFDWSDLSPGGISVSSWSATPTLTLTQPLVIGFLTSVEVSGVAAGGIYRLTNVITTNTGEIEVKSITLFGGQT